MANFLTTKQMQEILQVDRTTIYRMAESHRIPAFKVGNQWRFPRQQVETWLKTQSPIVVQEEEMVSSPSQSDVRRLLPVECVQQIQDTFADALGVMILVTDLQGQPLTRPSNPCGFFMAAESSPLARRRCVELWGHLAQSPGMQPTFVESHTGLLCARALIRVGSELRAMLVVGGIAPQQWPPDEAHIQQIARSLDLSPDLVHRHIHEVFVIEPEAQARILTFVQRIADIIAHILNERSTLFTKLENIAELTKV
jgi:excisionase family DNA binding protein